MNEREKILLQRDAARKWNAYWIERDHIAPSTERHICQCFPLPPEKVPNVIHMVNYDPDRGLTDEWEFRSVDGVLEYRLNGSGWRYMAVEGVYAAAKQALAEPYRLVSEEDGE